MSSFTSLFILGRQPAIGRAELESLFGAEHVHPAGSEAMLSDIEPAAIPFPRLGGSIRLAKILTDIGTTQWPDLARYLANQLPHYLGELPDGKLTLGLSVFGLPITSQQLFRASLELKKVCKSNGRSVRVVPNSEAALSSAQVLHNQLTGERGMELLLIRDGGKTWLAQTVQVQDITAYAARDRHRPKRDARVGMLPPKLAQTIVNLATGTLAPTQASPILDPFCGTGVILQEATLMGFSAYGSDLEPRMVDYTRQNMEWLATRGVDLSLHLEVGDATTHHWERPFAAVACETYLGRPLSGWPHPEKLHEIMGTCNAIVEKFLANIAAQTPAGTRLCVAMPAWKSLDGRTYHLSLLDRLGDLGYNQVSFEHAKTSELLYFRPGQFVARELLVITRK